MQIVEAGGQMINVSRAGDLYGIYGLGGCGRGIMPIARAQYSLEVGTADYSRLVFIDDSVNCGEERSVNSHRVMNFADFLATPARARYVNVAIADGSTRARLADRFSGASLFPWSVRACNSVVMDCVDVGEGASISPFVVITSNVRIGRYFHANLFSYVEHDCIIGDFVTFAPGVKCNGNIIIEDYAYLGSGCVIKQGVPARPLIIGKGATIGMGAVVTKDVAAGTTVVGNPARILIK